MNQYFLTPFNFHFGDSIKVDTSSFALTTHLASLKTKYDKLEIEQLVAIPVNLNKSSDVGKMMFLKSCI